MRGSTELVSEVSGGGSSGTVTFTDLQSDLTGPEGPEAEGPDVDPISGTITWDCD